MWLPSTLPLYSFSQTAWKAEVISNSVWWVLDGQSVRWLHYTGGETISLKHPCKDAPLSKHPVTFFIGVTGDDSLQAFQKPSLGMIGSRVVIWHVPMLHVCRWTINFRSEAQEDVLVVLPRMTCATLKHLSILAICESELGDTTSALALIVVPSLLKYHSRA